MSFLKHKMPFLKSKEGLMDKKGSMVLVNIFEIVFVIIVIYILMSTANAYAKSDTVFKTNAAEDIRLMANALAAVPGDAEVKYPYDVSDYFFILSQSKVSIFKKDESKDKWIERMFFLPEGFTAEGVVREKQALCLVKVKKKIFLVECDAAGTVAEQAESRFGGKFEPGFLAKVEETANYFGFNPDYLLAVMHFETGGTFSPSQENIAGSGAVGLIQFMPDTAKELGTTAEELSKMSQVEQMDYVKKHFEKNGGKKARTLADVYMAVLYPKAVGEKETYVLFTSPSTAYTQNKGLDVNKNGKITKLEAAAMVDASYQYIISNKDKLR